MLSTCAHFCEYVKDSTQHTVEVYAACAEQFRELVAIIGVDLMLLIIAREIFDSFRN